MIHPLDLMEPEETVGNLWHDMASRMGAESTHAEASVTLEEMRASITLLFKGLGGAGGIEILEAPAAASRHRLNHLRRIGTPQEMEHVADFDGERLRLPPQIQVFSSRALNRQAYLWLAAMAAHIQMPVSQADGFAQDLAAISANLDALREVYAACPGLRSAFHLFCQEVQQNRRRSGLPQYEARLESLIQQQLASPERVPDFSDLAGTPPRGYKTYQPIPIWLRLEQRISGRGAAADPVDPQTAPGLAVTSRKEGKREEREQADRRDSFIMHRFESIMSWAESLNLNRMVDDDDNENAQKAAEDQEQITLSQHMRRAASKLRISLDLSPQDADLERLAGKFTYPEWNHRLGEHMPAHCRILESEAEPAEGFEPDARLVARVQRQFAPLQPRRVMLPRQLDGNDLDLDAVVASRVDLTAGREGSDRIWQASRPMARDLSVAVLMDCSRSTEAVVKERAVIDTARDSLAALSAGISSAGDKLAIWGFSSLRRDRVYMTRAKSFEDPMGPGVTARIGAFKPGHYTRLGAAIRHASAQLAEEASARKLLLVLTDGKPNDLDHYEGVHGIEDSRMAVREAQALGQAVHGVVIDADGQDWFARIFGRAGFTLLPDPARLPRALPEIYHSLTMEQ
ncbi:NorD Nitric oxide reductase activation protein [Roseobacter sp. SK209-2-6]|uniref:nitric oxide reductase activation protein NorD n=1 Tax=Roseobacter sp. SK209-2-6 TaxID=388739 RepID=UPI0000F3EF45|nr:VWA domain-containing protein [Roseobacter sp. SK209-2-6]EBA16880.1 NorD Nitric oxide reductase activation protein [Roseobacter sp. SK209-2-6]